MLFRTQRIHPSACVLAVGDGFMWTFAIFQSFEFQAVNSFDFLCE